MPGCACTGVRLPVLSSGPAHLCLTSTGMASFQAHAIFALIYYDSFLSLPWLLVFLLPSVLQCLARVILPDLKSDLTLTCDSPLFSGGGPLHIWMDSFPWAYSPSLRLLVLALQKGLEHPTRAHHAHLPHVCSGSFSLC